MSKKTEEKELKELEHMAVFGTHPDALPQAMYDVYSATLNVHAAVPLPSWAQLDELQKNAWRFVARGVK